MTISAIHRFRVETPVSDPWTATALGRPPLGFTVARATTPGYTRAVARAWEILKNGIKAFGYRESRGQGQAFVIAGVRYFGRIEVHNHPPLGPHSGCTLYVKK